jgi:hypothetical protein
MENTPSWPVFLPKEVSHMAAPAIFDELHLRNTAESWADETGSGNGQRLPHNSGLNGPKTNNYLFIPVWHEK